jgi:hypothetical protein
MNLFNPPSTGLKHDYKLCSLLPTANMNVMVKKHQNNMNNLSQKPPRLSLPPGGAVVSSNWLVSYLIEGCGGTSSYFGPTHPGPPSRYLTQQSHSTHSASAESGDIDEH